MLPVLPAASVALTSSVRCPCDTEDSVKLALLWVSQAPPSSLDSKLLQVVPASSQLTVKGADALFVKEAGLAVKDSVGAAVSTVQV